MDVIATLNAALAGRYHLIREIGHGGMATVYLARDLKHDRTVAIKVLRPELAQAVGGERFLREINIAAKLQSPHILPLLQSGEADGLLYYVMPFVDGDSLRGVLATQGVLPPSEAMRFLRDIVDGLAHAHRHNVIHRDVKPDNIMIADRHAVVMDFGVAKAMGDATSQRDLTSIGFSLGTPAYMAPEQVAADPNIDERADIYAVGVVAYEMLSGKPPFSGTPQAILAAQISTPPVPLLTMQPGIPSAVAGLVMKCLAKEPAQRYQTTNELLAAIESLSTPSSIAGTTAAAVSSRGRRNTFIIAAIAALSAVAVMVWTQGPGRSAKVTRSALPELMRLIEAGEQDSAFTVAMAIDTVWSSDSALKLLPAFFKRRATISTVPAAVEVCRASFGDTTKWYCLPPTPTDSVTLPNRVGLFRFRKPGFRTTYRTATVPFMVSLDSVTAPHPEMERIAGGDFDTFLVGSDGNEVLKLGEFRMDRFEITNRQYKAFVDAGGYRDQKHWEHAFRENGINRTFAEAMGKFVDRTGRPGPSTWEGGDFPTGQGDMPVGGVSWYEAAAYAKFVGKSLPTLYHWVRAARVVTSRFIVPLSNLEGKGPMPVGKLRGVSAGGVSDMAGNVREWCINESGRDHRFILGGGWSDPAYSFTDAYAQPAMDRAVINGIRLALYAENEPNLAKASKLIVRVFSDYPHETAVPDAVFASFLPQFDYDPSALNAKTESRDSSADNYVVERVSFDAAYGNERMFAWVYLPKNGKPPLQSVVFFPGSGQIGAAPSTSANGPDSRVSYILQSGRAVVMPIYKSTNERSDSLHTDIPDKSIFWRDHVVMWVKDYKRTLDYLSTRADFDSTKFAYSGFSWGSNMAAIVLAVDKRPKAAILYVAGLTMERSRPEVDPFQYLPRVRIPVLMLNGRYDFYFPVATSQEPYFKNLGTAPADKRYVVYEGGHDVPRTQPIKEGLAWLDKYLGPVR